MKMDKVAPDDLPKKDEFDYNKALTWFLGNFFYEGNSDIPGLSLVLLISKFHTCHIIVGKMGRTNWLVLVVMVM